MADDKADKTQTESEAQAIDASDLDPDELAKAIEESVAHEHKPVKKSAKKDTKADKSGASKKATAKDEAPAQSDEDQGVPIIVKRHSGYVAPPAGASSDKAESEDKEETKPLEPPSKTQKTLQPAAEEQEVTATEEQSKPEQVSSDQPRSAEAPADNPQPEPLVADSKGPQTAQGNPVAQAPPTTPQPQAPAAEPQAPEGTKDPTEPQKPTVFDTTEYHLPIKSKGRNYINSTVAWTVLLLALAIAAAYVLYRLDIVELGDFRIIG